LRTTPIWFVSPFREDGTTYGTPTQTWALVVDGKVYVRAANGQESRRYRAAIIQSAGRVRVGDTFYNATFEAAGDENKAAIDAAYDTKYHGSQLGPRSARRSNLVVGSCGATFRLLRGARQRRLVNRNQALIRRCGEDTSARRLALRLGG
jgi:hypothetical protein